MHLHAMLYNCTVFLFSYFCFPYFLSAVSNTISGHTYSQAILGRRRLLLLICVREREGGAGDTPKGRRRRERETSVGENNICRLCRENNFAHPYSFVSLHYSQSFIVNSLKCVNKKNKNKKLFLDPEAFFSSLRTARGGGGGEKKREPMT